MMRKTLLFSLAVLLLVTVALLQMNGQKQTRTDSDEVTIRRAWQDYVAAWNKHDRKLLAPFLTDDVDRRTNDGRIYNGRDASLAAIEKSFGIDDKDGTFIPSNLFLSRLTSVFCRAIWLY
jgi:ketosteroid isomerase-like protein